MIRPLERMDLITISTALKPIQKKALLATRWDMSPVEPIASLWEQKPIAAAFDYEPGKLAAVGGAVVIHPGVASTFMYATTDMPKVIIEMTRFATKALFPILRKMDCHRIHSLGLLEDEAGNAWKERVLGFKREAVMKAYGRGKEDFVLHALT